MVFKGVSCLEYESFDDVRRKTCASFIHIALGGSGDLGAENQLVSAAQGCIPTECGNCSRMNRYQVARKLCENLYDEIV